MIHHVFSRHLHFALKRLRKFTDYIYKIPANGKVPESVYVQFLIKKWKWESKSTCPKQQLNGHLDDCTYISLHTWKRCCHLWKGAWPGREGDYRFKKKTAFAVAEKWWLEDYIFFLDKQHRFKGPMLVFERVDTPNTWSRLCKGLSWRFALFCSVLFVAI